MPPRRKTPAHQQIDASLKRAFDELAEEPVPPRFTDLLQRLKARDTAANPDDTDRRDSEDDAD